MPKVAHTQTVMDWHRLIENARKHADLPGMGEQLAELEVLLNRARELHAHRARLRAESQTATRDLADTERRGKVLTGRIRSLLKAVYGTTNDGLLAFGVRPRPIAQGDKPSEVMLPPLQAAPALANESAEDLLPGDAGPSDQDG
ncbi:MAG TPA: hypothetical protein VF789_02195 [Thermoanaerobaculia bacterium]